MSNIDKRALREAVAERKIAGEASYAVRPANHCTERLSGNIVPLKPCWCRWMSC
jgi:hypothetical protein